jgi:hypothetical protein
VNFYVIVYSIIIYYLHYFRLLCFQNCSFFRISLFPSLFFPPFLHILYFFYNLVIFSCLSLLGSYWFMYFYFSHRVFRIKCDKEKVKSVVFIFVFSNLKTCNCVRLCGQTATLTVDLISIKTTRCDLNTIQNNKQLQARL